jgi:hypothetical protein
MENITYSAGLVFVVIVVLAFFFRVKIANIERRLISLKRVEAKIDLLLKQDNLAYDPMPGIPPDIVEALQAGETIRAISLYRTLHNCSLKEAKEAIERIGQ